MPPGGEPAFDIIARALAPCLGANMARAAVEVNRNKLGLKGPELSSVELDELLVALAPGLRVFVGDARTRRILDGIRLKIVPKGDDR